MSIFSFEEIKMFFFSWWWWGLNPLPPLSGPTKTIMLYVSSLRAGPFVYKLCRLRQIYCDIWKEGLKKIVFAWYFPSAFMYFFPDYFFKEKMGWIMDMFTLFVSIWRFDFFTSVQFYGLFNQINTGNRDTADFIKKVPGVYTHSTETIYLS